VQLEHTLGERHVTAQEDGRRQRTLAH
jgi:hypothetical protein